MGQTMSDDQDAAAEPAAPDTADTDAEIANIERTIANDSAAYWQSQWTQDRYAELLAAREAGQPAAAPDANAERRAEIERLISDNSSEYWQGRDSERLQQEYHDLITAAEAEADSGPSEAELETAARTADKELADLLGDADAADLSAELEAASEVIQQAYLAAAAHPLADADVGALDNTAFEDFRDNTVVGQALRQRLGGDMARRMARAEERYQRVKDRLSDDDRATVEAAWREWSVERAAAIIEWLGR